MGHGIDKALPKIYEALEDIKILYLSEMKHFSHKHFDFWVVGLDELLGRVRTIVAKYID